ncbi:hypothetical protein RGQ15_20225 [Paracoccus sp. MBLB3053]|uniref:PepSY domain-containing protein n=1 Tax=Paracoccus aurantius TaxID=3073814 RepID=A0ABU2HXV5_9RHOB|nr:hypothetical protein [Paracoccus sp. MBLB3053]MDS9469886.1 hypothetical protein [Paracoccus sp. MBLB3053]
MENSMLNRAFLPLLIAVSFATTAKANTHLPSADDIRQMAQELSLTDLDVHPDEKGSDATGTLPSGTRVELDLHRNGKLDKIEARGHQTMPLADLMPLMPTQFSAPSLTPQSPITKLEFDDDHLEIEGRTGDGQEFKAEFSASGRLLEWKQD